jgi:hypothetical protein
MATYWAGWQQMGGLIDDEVLHAFAVVGDPRQAAAQIRARFGVTARIGREQVRGYRASYERFS